MLLSLAIFALLVVAALRAGRGLGLAALRDELRHAALGPLALAGVAALSMQLGRALFWKLTLPSISFVRLLRYGIVAAAGSTLLPARAGEAARVLLLQRYEGMDPIATVPVVIAERIFDLVAMAIVLAPLPFLLDDSPRWLTRAEIGLGVLAVAAALTMWRFADRVRASRFGTALARFDTPGRLVAAITVLTTAWLADLLALRCVAWAEHVALPSGALLLVLFTVNLALLVPTTPAQLGVHEAGTLVALTLLGVPRVPAVAFALLYHAVHFVPLVVAAALQLPLRYGPRRTQPRVS